MSHQHLEYRGAIALNNLGVSLLEKHAYKQAYATLEGAVISLKSVSSLRSQGLCNDDCLLAKIHERLQAAASRYSHPEPSSVHLPVSVLEQDETMSSFPLAVKMDARSDVLYPVHIDLVDSDLSSLNMDLLSAVTVYNCGIALLSMAKTVESASEAAQLRQTAVTVLRQSRQILSLCTDPLQIVCLSIFILQSKYQALAASGAVDDAGACLLRLTFLRAAAEGIDYVKHIDDFARAAAAA